MQNRRQSGAEDDTDSQQVKNTNSNDRQGDTGNVTFDFFEDLSIDESVSVIFVNASFQRVLFGVPFDRMDARDRAVCESATISSLLMEGHPATTAGQPKSEEGIVLTRDFHLSWDLAPQTFERMMSLQLEWNNHVEDLDEAIYEYGISISAREIIVIKIHRVCERLMLDRASFCYAIKIWDVFMLNVLGRVTIQGATLAAYACLYLSTQMRMLYVIPLKSYLRHCENFSREEFEEMNNLLVTHLLGEKVLPVAYDFLYTLAINTDDDEMIYRLSLSFCDLACYDIELLRVNPSIIAAGCYMAALIDFKKSTAWTSKHHIWSGMASFDDIIYVVHRLNYILNVRPCAYVLRFAVSSFNNISNNNSLWNQGNTPIFKVRISDPDPRL